MLIPPGSRRHHHNYLYPGDHTEFVWAMTAMAVMLLITAVMTAGTEPQCPPESARRYHDAVTVNPGPVRELPCS